MKPKDVMRSVHWDNLTKVWVSYDKETDTYSHGETHEEAIKALESAIRLKKKNMGPEKPKDNKTPYEKERYRLTRTGKLVARCLVRPFDTMMRDEIERAVYVIASKNPRPIILENDMPELITLLEETVGNVRIMQEVK